MKRKKEMNAARENKEIYKKKKTIRFDNIIMIIIVVTGALLSITHLFSVWLLYMPNCGRETKQNQN